MDNSKKQANPNPRERANCLSVFLFTFVVPLFKKGYTTTLEESDIFDPLPEDNAWRLGDRLDAKWKLQLNKKNPSFLKAVINTFWYELLRIGIMLGFLELCFRLAQPLLLGELLKYFKHGSTMTQKEALYYAGGMIAINLIFAFAINHYMILALHVGMKIRVASCSVIYRKALRLSKTALGETASGKVVNLLSNDVSRFDIITPIYNYLWTSPISAVIILYFMYNQAGISGLIGMGVVFCVVPIQIYTGTLSSRFRLQTALKTDERVRLMEEIITGVQVIKMYAWEYPFAKLIRLARKAELNVVRKSGLVRGLYMMFVLFTTRCALYAALISMVLMGYEIETNKIFVFQSFFAILSHTMSGMFVRSISEIAETLVGFRRLQTFMMHEEYVEKSNSIELITSLNGKVSQKTDDGITVSLKDMNAKWNSASSDDVLKDINLLVGTHKLVGIIGPVGSGKSSLLQTLLGELDISHGSMKLNGSISYASQEPWVFAASVRQNILFGQPYDRHHYNNVTRVCALKKDFEQFPNGDMTMVGDRGASLSGGQKARINLARAVYRKADIYLFDDPLSAVDTHVGKQLFEHCINDFLATKTRILVTHQLQYMKDADHLIILRDGRIEMQGTFNEIVKSDLDYAQMLTAEPELTEEEQKLEFEKAQELARTLARQKSASINSLASSVGENDNAELKAAVAEQSSKGTVKGSLFLKYFKNGGNCCSLLILALLFLLAQSFSSGCDWFVQFWATEEEYRQSETAEKKPYWDKEIYMYIYTGLIVGVLVFALVRSMIFYVICIRCSQKLHDNMFISIIKTSMRFFDTNPAGRILNRFSKDMGSIDELLPKAMLDATQVMLIMTGAIILTCSVNPLFIIPIIIVGIIFQLIKQVYLKTSKNVKRMEGITRSPVFTHLNATLQGLTTIRAYGAQSILQNEFDRHQDLNTGAWYMFICCSSAFGFSLDLLCFIFISSVILVLLLLVGSSETAGNVGLAITQSISLTGLVQWGMRQSAEVQNQLMSVERILEYTGLPPEPNFESDKPNIEKWPSQAKITFQNTSMKYSHDGPFILKRLNITIEPGEKIGIVGRTGAGKSSLIAALFRMALVEGQVIIDGVDTKNIDLQNLRKKISIIPQDPVLFSGTMRRNLDPFEEYPDDVLWNALHDVELKEVLGGASILDSRVLDHGSNFSVGQRQLVCLARAIIRNNKILLLDEATANVDPQTDLLIQKTIADKFADCTVLTVAHRLNTIMESDKVLVMAAGEMIEFDHPHILLQNKDGHFTKMVEETGPTMTDQLINVARVAYERKLKTTYL